MASIPARPKIYHITHLGNLSQIVTEGKLWSDAKRIEQGLDCEIVGLSEIKKRRLGLTVDCHPETMVGQYVPFYFCPRSIMLFILHRGNHPELNYREGQQSIIHLQADLFDTVRSLGAHGVRWAFSNTNASAKYANFFASLDQLGEVNWEAVDKTDFRSSDVKEAKQAEFLVFESFPWTLVERIGAANPMALRQVQQVLLGATHRPASNVEIGWYF